MVVHKLRKNALRRLLTSTFALCWLHDDLALWDAQREWPEARAARRPPWRQRSGVAACALHTVTCKQMNPPQAVVTI